MTKRTWLSLESVLTIIVEEAMSDFKHGVSEQSHAKRVKAIVQLLQRPRIGGLTTVEMMCVFRALVHFEGRYVSRALNVWSRSKIKFCIHGQYIDYLVNMDVYNKLCQISTRLELAMANAIIGDSQ